MYVHSNIKYLRKKDGQSQEVWGKRFKLTRGMVDSYERQVAKPDSDTIQAVCKAYKISIDAIYSVDFNANPAAALPGKQDLTENELMKAKDDVIHAQAETIDLLKDKIAQLTNKK